MTKMENKMERRQVFAEQVIEFLKEKKEFDNYEMQKILNYAYQKVRFNNNLNKNNVDKKV